MRHASGKFKTIRGEFLAQDLLNRYVEVAKIEEYERQMKVAVQKDALQSIEQAIKNER